jgi:hypothetical protein
MQQLNAPFTRNVLYPKKLELNLVPPSLTMITFGWKTILTNKLVKNLTILYNNKPIK